MRFDRREFLAASVTSIAAPMRLGAHPPLAIRPEDYGAQGDGVTDDSKAFRALADDVNRRGGGEIWLSAGKTYMVGEQHKGGEYGWSPQPLLALRSLRSPITIRGNGARLRCRAGLRFGTFDVETEHPIKRAMPNYRSDELASPYRALVSIQDCWAPVEIRDLELDGNVEQLQIGGPFGDTGWQIPAMGLWLKDNHAGEMVTNLFTHHHALDGVLLDGVNRRLDRSQFKHVIARYNGRQGLSITGGYGYDFEDCEFSFTGHSVVASAPSAGVDIEAEGEKTVTDLTFSRCKFLNNKGVGLLAEAGPSEKAVFRDCLFVGDEVWSAWPRKPHFRFENCEFVGAVVNAFADRDPTRATHFTRCRFTADPRLSSTRKVYEGGGPIVNLGESLNVLFDRCRFELRNRSVLPWSWAATYRDCLMSQVSKSTAMTKGKYLGRTVIDGAVDLYGSMIAGVVILNGTQLPTGPVGADVRPW